MGHIPILFVVNQKYNRNVPILFVVKPKYMVQVSILFVVNQKHIFNIPTHSKMISRKTEIYPLSSVPILYCLSPNQNGPCSRLWDYMYMLIAYMAKLLSSAYWRSLNCLIELKIFVNGPWKHNQIALSSL